MVALNWIVISTLALAGSASARRKGECLVTGHDKTPSTNTRPSTTSVAPFQLSDFKPGVEWEIVLHQPIKHDNAADLIPTAAKVWDVDMAHARDHPEMIPLLKVLIILLCVAT